MLRRRAALAGSLLLHVMAIGVVMLWVARRPPTPPATEQPIEMVFQRLAEPAPEVPQAPPAEAAPIPPDVPTPPAPEPQATAPPAPPPPPVEEAPAVPSVPTPVTPAATSAEEPPRPPTKPSPIPVQPRPVIRARPAAREPATSAPPSSVPAPAPAPAEAPPVAISTEWRLALSAWLAAHKSYPEAARRRGEEGSIALRFTVERSGRVTEVSVVRGSGSSILDAAAEAMLRNATVPAFAGTMSQERIVVTVQVRFALTD